MMAKGDIIKNHCRKVISTPWALMSSMAIRLPGEPAGVMMPPVPAAMGRLIIRQRPRADLPGLQPLTFRNIITMP